MSVGLLDDCLCAADTHEIKSNINYITHTHIGAMQLDSTSLTADWLNEHLSHQPIVCPRAPTLSPHQLRTGFCSNLHTVGFQAKALELGIAIGLHTRQIAPPAWVASLHRKLNRVAIFGAPRSSVGDPQFDEPYDRADILKMVRHDFLARNANI
jgi:hypothetical protein